MSREVNKVDYADFLCDVLEERIDELEKISLRLLRVLKRLEKLEEERTRLLLRYYERITKE